MLAKMFLFLAILQAPDGDIMKKFKGPFESEAACKASAAEEKVFLKANNIDTKKVLLMCIETPFPLPGQSI